MQFRAAVGRADEQVGRLPGRSSHADSAPRPEPPVRTGTGAPLAIGGHQFRIVQQGQGPAVLFCHGFPDTAATWRWQMAAVADAGYRAVALDMRGFGGSYAPDAVEAYSALHTAGDLVGLLDALGIGTAVLVGHDWGADVSQQATLLRPDRFRAIVSISIPIAPRGDVSIYDGIKGRGLGDRFYAFDLMKPSAEALFVPAERSIPSVLHWLSGSPPPEERWDPADPAKHMLRPAPIAVPDWADPDYVRHNIAAFGATNFHGGLNYYRAAQTTFDQTPALKGARITQPALYVWGGADGLCRFLHPEPPSLEEARRDAPGLVDLIRLDGVGHWVQHEAADRLSAELLTFLAAIPRW